LLKFVTADSVALRLWAFGLSGENLVLCGEDAGDVEAMLVLSNRAREAAAATECELVKDGGSG